ncbi:hypothetical protein MMC25_000106 [Agyrium rufum]|nr:hypothetical protein [Agyrium rufum]
MAARHTQFEMFQKSSVQPPMPSRHSVAQTYISDTYETDFEEDLSDFEEYSGRRSEDSTGHRSESTLSSFDELRTPNDPGNGFNSFDFQMQDHSRSKKSVEGPVGPHLFRLSQASSTAPTQVTSADVGFILSMSPPQSPQQYAHTYARLEAPLAPVSQAPPSPLEQLEDLPLMDWSPYRVTQWMERSGFEESLIEQFFTNDISGLTLIDLQYEDLKELGIASFGQRRRLWGEISKLKESMNLRPLPTPTESQCFSPPLPTPASTQSLTRKCSNPNTPDDDRRVFPDSVQRLARRVRASDDIISPAESVSIVAIEQLLPKAHKCSKGESCSKWQKQQRKLAKIATDFSAELQQISDARDARDGRFSPAESGLEPPSVVGPSVVASSDLLGPGRLPQLRLQEETLRVFQTRDPQENVRQFLDFQHIDRHTPPTQDPVTPPYEMFPPLSPPSAQPPHRNLGGLPKLTIPNQHVSDPYSPNATARPHVRGTPITAMEVGNKYNGHDIFRLASPASEMDVPVTAFPVGPIERDICSSVPPDMRFGGADPIHRTQSRSENRRPPIAFYNSMTPGGLGSSIARSHSVSGHRRRPSLGMPSVQETHLDGDKTPAATEIHREGWMKKRKAKMLRHEWHDNHFRLHGTHLAMHKDEKGSSKELETIDVSDYSVACSTLNSNKINAAFKALKISSAKKDADPASAYTFQLLPTAEKKGILNGANGKTHHFAVKTGNERIDWMRDLLLAKASSQKGEGYQVKINGNLI